MKTIYDEGFIMRTTYFSSGIDDRFKQIDWREGEIVSSYFEINPQSYKKDLYLIFSGEFYTLKFVLIARGLVNFNYFQNGPDSVSNGIFEYTKNKTELVKLEGYSNGFVEVEAETLLLLDLGNIEIKNPYQLLIDLELIKT